MHHQVLRSTEAEAPTGGCLQSTVQYRARLSSPSFTGANVSLINGTSKKGPHTFSGSKSPDVLHNTHEAVVAIVSQDVRVPTIGWGGVVDVCSISRDKRVKDSVVLSRQ
jgi:hypothetical protein